MGSMGAATLGLVVRRTRRGDRLSRDRCTRVREEEAWRDCMVLNGLRAFLQRYIKAPVNGCVRAFVRG